MGKLRAVRKQPIVLSSDDEGDGRDSLPPPKRLKRETLTKATRSELSGRADRDAKPSRILRPRASSPKPQLSRATKKTAAKAPAASPKNSPVKAKPDQKPISSFFKNAPQTRWKQPTPSPDGPAPTTLNDDIDDIFDSSDDEFSSRRPNALPVRKREPTPSINVLPKATQRFLKATTSTAARSTPPSSQIARVDSPDLRPWNEKYGPISLDELAVHKRKVADVRAWLSDVFAGRLRKRLLLLKGPAGSGKTTTLSLLSKEMPFDVHEWKNPVASSCSSEGFVSVTAQFEDFVRRTGAFGSLAFEEPAQQQPLPTPSSRQKQLILVEEFPNTFARASSAVQSFRSSILNFLAASTPSASSFFSSKLDSEQSITPVVMIISETLLSTSTAAADSFTAHRLLGPEILTHAGVSVIEFNPIAPTYMAKALELVVHKEARKSGRKTSAGPQVIQRLSELGDIRSAVSSLEFLSLRGDEDGGWGSRITFTKKKVSAKDIPITKMEQESLEMVTQRESTLGIFHAVGKVVYNKRLADTPNGATVPQPPNWFPERRRPKASEVNVETLIDELGTDTQTFVAALHENYVLSCEAGDTEATMDAIDGCIDALSDADLLSSDRFGKAGRNFQGTSADSLRQDELSFQTGVRGLLYNLPNPVKRIAPPPGLHMGAKAKPAARGSANVMYYPASLRIWQQQEEVGGLLDMWVSRVQRGEVLNPGFAIAKRPEQSTGGVDTWRKSSAFATRTDPAVATQSTQEKELNEPIPVLLGSGGSARNELLLERLPYLTRILRKPASRSSTIAVTLREIEKTTSFSGSSMAKASGEDEDDHDVGEPGEQEQWSTDRPGPETPRKKRKMRIVEGKKAVEEENPLAMVVEKEVGKLVLSDDDIED